MSGLSKHNPIWDQTRAQSECDRVYEDDGILIATNFECGNGKSIRSTGADHYEMSLEPEPGDHVFSGQSYYFCVGLRNKTPTSRAIQLTAQANIDGKFSQGNHHAILKRGQMWGHLDPSAVHPDGDTDRVTFDVVLPASNETDATVFLSNFHWYPFTEFQQYIEQLEQNDLVSVSTYGESSDGRPLYRIDIGSDDPSAPCVLMSQTPQPSECGTWTCKAVIEYLLSDEGASALAQHRFVILPMTNPDGTVAGLGVSHPSGSFPYFEGKLTAEGDPSALPELKNFWQVLVQEKPWLFIEWHSNNWARRPGHMLLRFRPHLIEDESIRTLWEDIDRRLEAVPDVHHGNWTSHDEGMYQISFCFQAITRLNTISYMIKHHDKFPLKDIQQNAVACLKEALAAWDVHHAKVT